MIDYEYRRLKDSQEKRSWGITIFLSLCALLALFCIYFAWVHLRYEAHLSIIATVLLGSFAVVFVLGAIHGRKQPIRNALEELVHMLTIWP